MFNVNEQINMIIDSLQKYNKAQLLSNTLYTKSTQNN